MDDIPVMLIDEARDPRGDRRVRRGERILVVQTGFLGDVVLTTPLLAALRRRFPDGARSRCS